VSDRIALAAALARQPRLALAVLPTPLQDAPLLREALGGASRCPRIFVKRDDLTGLAGGGNKARKLDFLVGDARRAGATALITTGAVQSNHARMTAGAARIAGMSAELVLTAHAAAPADEGNLLLDRLFGARVHFVPSIDPALAVGLDEETVRRVEATIRARGGTPYVIPVGGSSAIGALGYVAGTLELCGQLDALGISATRLYFASGSRGTQAGLTLGAHLCTAGFALHGIAVSGGEPEKFERARRVARDAATLLGYDASVLDRPFVTDQGFIGDGYGLPTPDGLEAMLLAARTEALVLDATYTAKAMAALVRHVRDGVIDPGESIVFLHTGGSPAVFTRTAADALSQLTEWQVL
jgi:L-cysteate sulfo-lyase